MTGDRPTTPLIRRATNVDLPSPGRLGALLVQEHHDFDALRFLAPRVRGAPDVLKGTTDPDRT